VKNKAEQLIAALFYSCFGLFLLGFGAYFTTTDNLSGFGVFMCFIGLLLSGLGIYTIVKIIRAIRASGAFTSRIVTDHKPCLSLTPREEVTLQNEQADLGSSMAKHLVFGILILSAAIIVPFKFTSFRNYEHYHNDPEGNKTTVQVLGVPGALLAAGVVGFLFIYVSRFDLRKIKQDQEEKKKVILEGKVKAVIPKANDDSVYLVTIATPYFEFEEVEWSRLLPKPGEGDAVTLAVTLHAQFVLSLSRTEDAQRDRL
jgi:hypothetical protein